MKLNDICPCLARVYRTLNRPILRSKTDVDCKVYPDGDSNEPMISLKINGKPEIKLLDLLLALAAIKIFFSAVGAVVRLFRD